MARILVVDDDAKARRLVSIILERAGHTIIEAVNGLEGLSLAASEKPDLVICDLMMPIMGGLEAIRLMRKDKELSNLPVIVITSDTNKQTILNILDVGISYFLAKPLDFAKLKMKVQEVLDSRQSSKNREPLPHQVDEYVKRPEGEQLVVICEQDKGITGRLVKELENHYELITVADGASCLNAVFKNRPDVVLIDFDSPVLSASEVASKIRDTPAFHAIGIVTFVDSTDEKKAMEQSELFDKLIRKPYPVGSVPDSLQEILGNNHFSSENEASSTTIKLSFNGLKWASEHYDKAIRRIDRMLSQILESGKKSLIIDGANAKNWDAGYSQILLYVVDRIAETNLNVTLITDAEDLISEIEAKGYQNVLLKSPALS